MKNQINKIERHKENDKQGKINQLTGGVLRDNIVANSFCIEVGVTVFPCRESGCFVWIGKERTIGRII